MPSPTGLIGLSGTAPAAPSGRLNVKWQTDSGSPIQNFSANIPNIGTVVPISGTTDTIDQSRQGKLTNYSSASAVTVTIATPTDASWTTIVNMTGAGAGTFSPASGTINGGGSYNLSAGGAAYIWWDGTNYFAITLGGTGTTTGAALICSANYAITQSATAFALKGEIVIPVQNLTLSKIFANIYGNSGDQYIAVVATLTGTSTIGTILATSSTFTFGSTETGIVVFDVASIALTAGTKYGIWFNIISGSTTTACALDSASGETWSCPGFQSLVATALILRSANISPGPGTVLTTNAGSQYSINLAVSL